MRILLLGEYSRLHLSLAEGLRKLNHEVVLASDGDLFKNYERDIDLTRKSSGLLDTLSCMVSVFNKFSKFKGFDVVQLINPCFTTLNIHINKILFNKLKKNNAKVFLGAFGDDSYWVKTCMDNKVFKYSEFFVNGKSTNLKYNKILEDTWINSSRKYVNEYMAKESDGIIACIYEYYMSYVSAFPDKLGYIPLPINTQKIEFEKIDGIPEKVVFFVGVNKDREEYKGTDIMEKALMRIESKYPNEVVVSRVESLGYQEYQRKMSEAYVVLDQLYSHSPSMNALLAMAQGKVLVGGGEPEIYKLLNDSDNHPIVNVFPTEEDVFNKLEYLVLNKNVIPELSNQGRCFVEKHHDYIQVAGQYIDFWTKK